MRDQTGFVRAIGLKVLVGFTIVLLAVVVAGVTNFLSLNKLVNSVNILSKPDEKLIYARQLLDQLANEEGSIRAYMLTQDSQYLKSSQLFSDSVHLSLGDLKRITLDNNEQKILADSIQLMVENGEALMNQFVERRAAEIDSQQRKNALASNATFSSPAKNVTESSDKKMVAPKNKNLWQRIFKSNSKKIGKNSTDQIVASPTIKPDPQQTSSAALSTVILQQESLLKKQMLKWSSDELILLQQVQEVMNNIGLEISLLEKNENALNSSRAAEAAKVAGTARQIMTLIGVLGIITTLLFIYLILTDVTRSKRLHTQLTEERMRAEKLAKVKEEFLANMSHEIRTPLNAIVGFADQLAHEKQNDRQQKFTSAIQRSSEHLLELVNQVLDFSKLEAGKQQHHIESFDFYKLIHELHDTFKLKAAEKNIWFTYHIDHNIPQFVSGDLLSVKQIIINLIGNALKFTDYGGVTISCFLEENKDDTLIIRTEVKDTGIGIPQAMNQKIFDEFNQRDQSISGKYGGTGLGLTITKKLIEFLNGSVEVQSEEGLGSVFITKLPFKKSDAAGILHSELLEFDTHCFYGKRALIADDEEMNVMLCQTILEKWGMKMVSAHNGKDALEKFNASDFDVVLLDVQMPVMNGIELAQNIRSSENQVKKNIPLIALTANVYTNQNYEMKDADFTYVIFKPFKEKELFESMNKLFANEKISTFTEDNNQHSAAPIENGEPLFSLKYLETTSGSNDAFLLSMIHSFIVNNRKHLLLLKEALDEQHWETIGMIAHKMIPSYSYLQIEKAGQNLRELEECSMKKDYAPIPALITDITSATENIFQLLEEEILIKQQESAQFVTRGEMIATQPK